MNYNYFHFLTCMTRSHSQNEILSDQNSLFSQPLSSTGIGLGLGLNLGNIGVRKSSGIGMGLGVDQDDISIKSQDFTSL